MNEDGLHFARDVAKKMHRYFDDKVALAEFLTRRHLSQGHTMAERRAALRLSRQQATLGLDLQMAANSPEFPTVKGNLSTSPIPEDSDTDSADFGDDLDDDPRVDDGHFYDDLLEDV